MHMLLNNTIPLDNEPREWPDISQYMLSGMDENDVEAFYTWHASMKNETLVNVHT